MAADKMHDSEFHLRPFAGSIPYAVGGNIRRTGSRVEVLFRVTGQCEDIRVQNPGIGPQRRDRLWQGTCFEVFVKEATASAYWEFNLAPGGDWNLYAFSGYRRGMMEETRVADLPMTTTRGGGLLQVAATIDLGLLGLQEAELRLALSAVILDRQGGLRYWALAHPADKPDFHNDKGFQLHLV